MTKSRLSYLNITSSDPLKLAPFFKEMKTPHPEWQKTSIYPAEVLRMDLLADRLYQNKNLSVILQVILGLDNRMDKVKSGTEFQYPPEHYIRERIKYWQSYWANK